MTDRERTAELNSPKGSRIVPRILVVDDEQAIRELVATALTFARFEVVTASDGVGALNATSLESPDRIVLDVTMPGFDGWGVCRRLRRDGDTTPVIFLTARDDTRDTLRGFEMGTDDYITKPLSLEKLVARVHAVLRRGTPPEVDSAEITYADLCLDEDARRVWRVIGSSTSRPPSSSCSTSFF